MRKFILFFVLLVLFLAFSVFLVNAYLLQKNYFEDSKNDQNPNQINNILYSREDYDKAINDKKILVLFFTSNWCQECLDQDILNSQVFEELTQEGVVGLKIHILDSETTTETNALSQKFDVTKEQSFVILDKNGVVYFKYTGILSKDQLKQKILEATGQ